MGRASNLGPSQDQTGVQGDEHITGPASSRKALASHMALLAGNDARWAVSVSQAGFMQPNRFYSSVWNECVERVCEHKWSLADAQWDFSVYFPEQTHRCGLGTQIPEGA